MNRRPCSIEGCGKSVHGRGLCGTHYEQLRRSHGGLTRPTLKEKFWRGVGMGARQRHMDTPCWLWTQGQFNHGYGQLHNAGTHLLAHRVAYELEVGPIPTGLEVDHRCRTKLCVRPDHLRPVTRKQNRENLALEGRKGNRSGKRGVHLRSDGRWQAHVGHNGEQIWLGTFATIEEAEAAVIAKRNELFTHNELDRV